MKSIFTFSIILFLQTLVSGSPRIPPVHFQDSMVSPQFNPDRADWIASDVETIDDYLNQYVMYPDAARRNNQAGTSIIEFVVTEDGELQDFRVINSISEEIDREMIRAVSQTNGLWEPGRLNGMKVPMKKEVSLVFVPYEQYDLAAEASKHLTEGSEALFTEENPRKALPHLDQAVKLFPYNKDILSVRSLCRHQLGDLEGARQDWERVINMNIGQATQLETGYLIIRMRDLDGYEEFDRAVRQAEQ